MRVRAETSRGLGKMTDPYCFPCGATSPNAGHDSFVVVTIKLDDVAPSHGRELSLTLHVGFSLTAAAGELEAPGLLRWGRSRLARRLLLEPGRSRLVAPAHCLHFSTSPFGEGATWGSSPDSASLRRRLGLCPRSLRTIGVLEGKPGRGVLPSTETPGPTFSALWGFWHHPHLSFLVSFFWLLALPGLQS